MLTAASAAASTSSALTIHFVCPQNALRQFQIDLDAFTLRQRERRAKSFTSEIHVVSDAEYEALPSANWLPKATCLRLLISSYIPKDIQRIIYLDSDIMVAADLSELFRTHMHGHPIAAVQDVGMRQIYCESFGLDARHYFNAGVLLIGLTQWNEPANRALALFTEKGATYPCLDQDVLNIVFKDNWLELDGKWNVTEQKQPFASRWFEWIWPNGREKDRLPSAVYHMTPLKPWLRCCTSRCRFAYRQLAQALFEGGIEIVEKAPLVFTVISWLPLPLYKLMRLIWDANLTARHFIRSKRRKG